MAYETPSCTYVYYNRKYYYKPKDANGNYKDCVCAETCASYRSSVDKALDDVKLVRNVLCARARPLSPAPIRSHDFSTSPRCQTRALAPSVAVAVPSVSLLFTCQAC